MLSHWHISLENSFVSYFSIISSLILIQYVKVFWGTSCYLAMVFPVKPFSRSWKERYFSLIVKTIFRSSHQRCSIKNGILKNFTKPTWKQLCHSLIFNKVFNNCSNFIKIDSLALMFSCECFDIFKNTFFTEHLWTTASESSYAMAKPFLQKQTNLLKQFTHDKCDSNIHIRIICHLIKNFCFLYYTGLI